MKNHRDDVTAHAYHGAMAKQQGWRVVKTSGGYGVLKSSAGTKVVKSTVVRPTAVSGNKAQGATKSGR